MNTSQRLQPPAKLAVEYLAISALTPDPKNARKHTAKQIERLAKIIKDLGWSSPIVIDECNVILAGHARCLAAKSLGMTEVPCVRLSHLDAPSKKALAIADNAMTDASKFDDSILRDTLIELGNLSFDLDLTGLDMGAIDFLIDGPSTDAPVDPADLIDEADRDRPAVARLGDLWRLGDHRLLCGNALEADDYKRLMDDEPAAMVFSDPPYNVPVMGHVSGLGRHQHREFAMASGEMSDETKARFIVVMQRLHADDLAGHLLGKGGWNELKLQARATVPASIDVGRDRPHEVKVGDLLHEKRLPERVLERKLTDMGSINFQAQYQQDPVPATGNIVRRHWLQYRPANVPIDRSSIVLSLDTARRADFRWQL